MSVIRIKVQIYLKEGLDKLSINSWNLKYDSTLNILHVDNRMQLPVKTT